MADKPDVSDLKHSANLTDPAWIKALVEHSPLGIYAIDDQQRLIFVNTKLCEITGYQANELMGQDFQLLLTEKSLQLVTDRYKKRRQDKQVPTSYQFEIQSKDTTRKIVEVSENIMLDERGKPLTIGTMTDMTPRH
ncbi:MAG: PAS domain S-box protein [Desulfuromonadales bacterium]|nr:PAS domain S-box protein [Desulfuromonadales bacterium]